MIYNLSAISQKAMVWLPLAKAIDYRLSTIFAAYILDLIIGDPQWQRHPVRLIGCLIEKLEKILNTSKFNRKFCGTMLLVVVTLLTMLCIGLLLKFAAFIHPLFHYILSVLFIYFALSVKSLAVEVNKVYAALKSKDITKARNFLALIVGRDTHNLDEPEIVRASVETVAESITDGIVAPLFYVFIAGPVLMWGYKAINTLDSMVGYRNPRFIEFGKASAKIDAAVNFIPSKISAILICIASLFFLKNWYNAIQWARQYFLKGTRFNGASSQAPMAGALGVQLGGINYYAGIPVKIQLIGDNRRPLALKNIRESIQISYMCSVLALAIGMGICKILR